MTEAQQKRFNRYKTAMEALKDRLGYTDYVVASDFIRKNRLNTATFTVLIAKKVIKTVGKNKYQWIGDNNITDNFITLLQLSIKMYVKDRNEARQKLLAKADEPYTVPHLDEVEESIAEEITTEEIVDEQPITEQIVKKPANIAKHILIKETMATPERHLKIKFLGIPVLKITHSPTSQTFTKKIPVSHVESD